MTDPQPWLVGEGGEAVRRHAPATLRNRDAITTVLRAHLPDAGLILEIASGSGEHIVHFARAMPQLDWQPSDREPDALRSIAVWSAEAGLGNLHDPLLIDVEQATWPVQQADAIVCINMVHISPWSATASLFGHASAILPPGAVLFLYGPFTRNDAITADSNLAFDASLKSRNPDWGLRDVSAIDELAARCGFRRAAMIEMPANNLSLIYHRL